MKNDTHSEKIQYGGGIDIHKTWGFCHHLKNFHGLEMVVDHLFCNGGSVTIPTLWLHHFHGLGMAIDHLFCNGSSVTIPTLGLHHFHGLGLGDDGGTSVTEQMVSYHPQAVEIV